MARDDLTTHGFRSSFRDWASETGRPNDVAEAALAHTVGNATVAAYARGDLLERRRRLMDDWAKFCETLEPGKVIALPKEAVVRL
jgi:integrase